MSEYGVSVSTASLVAALQTGRCVDLGDNSPLEPTVEKLRSELLELVALRRWRATVRLAIHGGCSGFEALDRANTEMIEGR